MIISIPDSSTWFSSLRLFGMPYFPKFVPSLLNTHSLFLLESILIQPSYTKPLSTFFSLFILPAYNGFQHLMSASSHSFASF